MRSPRYLVPRRGQHPQPQRKYPNGTLNIYKTAARLPNRQGTHLLLNWEDPKKRIGRAVIWLLQNAKKQGLTARKDGYVRVQELLRHPRFSNVDFPTLEKVVRHIMGNELRLSYAPRMIPYSSASSPLDSWWIGLERDVEPILAGQRIREPEQAPVAIHQVPSSMWPAICRKGLTPTDGCIFFSTKTTLPLHYKRSHTFIFLDTARALRSEVIPLYQQRIINQREDQKTVVIHSPATHIPLSFCQSAIQISMEKRTLLERKKDRKDGSNTTRLVAKAAGVQALRRLGYESVVENSIWGLGAVGSKIVRDTAPLSNSSVPAVTSRSGPTTTTRRTKVKEDARNHSQRKAHGTRSAA